MKIDYGNCDDDDDDELGYSVLNLISGLTISSAASVVFVAQRIHNTMTRRDVVDSLRDELCNESTTSRRVVVLWICCEASSFFLSYLGWLTCSLRMPARRPASQAGPVRIVVVVLWIRCVTSCGSVLHLCTLSQLNGTENTFYSR